MNLSFPYMFVLTDELQPMRTARRARCFERGGSLLSLYVFRLLPKFPLLT